jgi:Flp pilus assembly protein TadB
MAVDRVRLLLVGTAILILCALFADEVMPQLTPTLRRLRQRYKQSGLTWRTVFTPLLLVVLALLMRAPLVSLYLVAVAVTMLVRDLRRAEKEHTVLKPDQILQFVVAFRGEYSLQPVVFSMLEKVTEKTSEPLRSLMRITAQTYFLTSSPERAFQELRARTDNVYVSQLAYVLEMSENAAPQAVIKALEGLEARLRSHSELRREVRAEMSSIATQTLIMQVVAGGILLAVALVPSLRQVYTSRFGQAFYVGVLTIMLASSYYIDRETQGLAERIS